MAEGEEARGVSEADRRVGTSEGEREEGKRLKRGGRRDEGEVGLNEDELERPAEVCFF